MAVAGDQHETAVALLCALERGRLADQIGAGCQSLTKLDCRRANLLQSRGIIDVARHARAKARQPAQPLYVRRGQWIALDPLQRAMPRQGPAPFEQAPQMGDGSGQIFQPLWIATRPPRIGSALTWPKLALRIIAGQNGQGGELGRAGEDGRRHHDRREEGR